MPMHPDPVLAGAAALGTARPPSGQVHGVAVPGSERPGYSAVYRHYRTGTGPIPLTVDPKITTMHEAFESAAQKYPNVNCLGWREQDEITKIWSPYKWMDYRTVHRRKRELGSGLAHLHRRVGVTAAKFPIGLWAPNRPEWQIADLAIMSHACWSVSIYDTLGPSATEYILNHGEIVTVICSLNHVPTLIQLKDRVPSLKIIISMDPLDAGEPAGQTKKALLGAWATEKGIEFYDLAEVETIGRQNPTPDTPPTPRDLITINYTSGTTGNPKGVELRHYNCIAAASSAMESIMAVTPGEFILSYLPLAHIYARILENQALWAGASIGYFHGNILEILDDIKALRPHTFISVPRMYNRICNAIKEATVEQAGVKGALSRHIVSTKLEAMKRGERNTHAFYDRIWANKVKAALGFDRCRAMVSGSAPIAPAVLQFLRAVFSNEFMEGYGLTESYAVALGQQPQDVSAGNCGPPSPYLEVRLRGVPEMGYTADGPNPRGELLLRGSTIFEGYYKAPEVTAEAFDEDGWFKTGDICSVDSLGRFSIIDRVKNLLKLAQGEYISPEKIENQYLANMPIFVQGLVHGDSFQTCLVAIFGVERTHFSKFASGVLGKTVEPEDTKALLDACESPSIRKAVLKEMDRVAKRVKLLGFERVKNIHLCIEPFSMDNDLLTPTLKMKRAPAVRAYKVILDKLYEEIDAAITAKARL